MYPDWCINVSFEQTLVAQYENIIFQFPFYWFSCPPLLRLWFDEVLTRGWAYGTAGDKVKGKKIILAISTGIPEADYMSTGKYKYTMNELLRPFELIAIYTGMHLQAPYIACGLGPKATAAEIETTAVNYVQHLFSLAGQPPYH
jgi:putative NADPH-quinone reductase